MKGQEEHPKASAVAAKRWPKKAPSEDTEASAVAQIARFLRWSNFNMDLGFTLLCFFPLDSSLIVPEGACCKCGCEDIAAAAAVDEFFFLPIATQIWKLNKSIKIRFKHLMRNRSHNIKNSNSKIQTSK
ncbi:unnamed protein product [Coffea canephora]|uniref:Uncharacterized protein n=1 Tax=Coffea canephora TaxID=49390 RepID=A0A068UQ77_COFCA|nr:unnamed protein product [Coffea canephora]